MNTTHPMNSTNVKNRLDRLPLSRFHKMVLVILSFAYFFDFCDLNTFSYVAPALVKEWNITKNTIALITSVSYFGMFLGASFGGWFSDRFGRKRGLVILVTWFSSFSLLSALAWNPVALGVLRFLTSVGIGAVTILASTYISEFFPSKAKGKYQALCITIGICGIPAAGWVAKSVIPMAPWGWRAVFIFGGIGIVFPFIARKLEESARWHEARGQWEQASEIMARIERKVERETGKLPAPEPVSGDSLHHAAKKSVSIPSCFKARC